MRLVSDDVVEFRIKREYISKNSGKKSFFYTFEDEKTGSFELWSNDNMPLEKGKMYRLVFDFSIYNGERRINLKEVLSDGK